MNSEIDANNTNNLNNAKFIIEGLRSGVPYQELAKTVVFGRDKYLDHVRKLMETVEQERPPKFPAFVVRANYGEGKTHLLHSLWGIADDRDWVVSFVSLSKETPLERLDHLYPKVVQHTYLPGSAHAGIGEIFERALMQSNLLSEAALAGLSPRLMAVLECLVAGESGFDDLLADLAGSFMKVTDIRHAYRQNCGKSLTLPQVSVKDEAYQYFRLLDWLVRMAGFKGWLLLMDEVELIGKLGRGARSQAYANLGRLVDGTLAHTISVWALAGNFLSDVLLQRNDLEAAPAWLADRPKESHRVPWSKQGLDALRDSKLLDNLTFGQVKELIAQIYDLHQQAYGWTANYTADDLLALVRKFSPTQDTKVRTYVRLSLAILDIWLQYGENPTIEFIGSLHEVSIDEQPANPGDDEDYAVASREDGESAGSDSATVVIHRQALFRD